MTIQITAVQPVDAFMAENALYAANGNDVRLVAQTRASWSEPCGTASRPLSLRLLGGFAVPDRTGRKIDSLTRKAKALVGFLATDSAGSWPRDRLATLLWSTKEDKDALANLRQALYAVRQAIGPAFDNAFTIGTRLIERHPDAVDSDVLRLFDAAASGDDTEAGTALNAANRAPFLDGLDGLDPVFDEWLATERGRIMDLQLGLNLTAAEVDLRNERPFAAIDRAHWMIAQDPFFEPAQRVVIRSHLALHGRQRALDHFDNFAHMLSEELGARPEAETRELANRILELDTAEEIQALITG
ncbi:MAG: BTAD domain-containing putative transcriptional regulator [Pseudomonadota bacterium]